MKQMKKGWSLSTLLVTLVTSLLENLLTGKGLKAKIPGQGIIKANEGTITAGQDF